MKKTLIAFAVLIVALGLFVMPRVMNLTGDHDAGSHQQAAIGGPFTLVDHTGRTVTEKDFEGKLQLIYFGYTFCPDVCPTSLNVLAQALNRLGPDADKVTPIFITVDPERDTPAQLKDYVAAFHPNLVGLTGSPEQVAAATKTFKVYARKAGDKDAYTMDHSSILYLMDRKGAFLTHFGHDATPDQVAEGLRKHL